MLGRIAMTPPGTPREQRILLGIGFMMLAASILPVMNGIVQWLNLRYPPEQVIWARITGHLLIMLVLMLPRAGLRVVATNRPALQFGRSLCQLSSTSLYFVGLVTLPLAKAAAVGFLAPFVVALLAWPLLGEPLGVAGLVGVALVSAGMILGVTGRAAR